MKANQADYPIIILCAVLGVSTSGYYGWRNRPPSARARRDAELVEEIRAVHEQSRATYGMPRIHAELQATGNQVGRKRVARLMRVAGLHGVSRRRGFKTTVKGRERHGIPDLVDRNFVATSLNELWVADITYVPTWSGFVFLAVVVDAFSRKVAGWSMATHLRTSLVLGALDMAVTMRRPADVVHHSDQGCQYTSLAFGRRCSDAGVRPSTGSVGDCYDNAMCESFFATLECELIDRETFETKSAAKMAVFSFIEGFYNPRRRHSSLNYVSPDEFERAQADEMPDNSGSSNDFPKGQSHAVEYRANCP